MNRKGDKSLIVGLDIGTSKVTALVGGDGDRLGRFQHPVHVRVVDLAVAERRDAL